MSLQFVTIGLIRSPFKEKFGVPRQPGLVPQARASLDLIPPYDRPEAVSGLEGYSHIWLQFVFHQVRQPGSRWTVRPPRLGGNRRVGVFASRSPFRPNPIGLSVVRLEAIEDTGRGGVRLQLSGIDLVDGTPVLDIKPYLPYADSLPQALPGFAPLPPRVRFPVRFSPRAQRQLEVREDGEELKGLIEALLETDPRPACQRERKDSRTYGIRLLDFDLRWRVQGGRIDVLGLEPTRPA